MRGFEGLQRVDFRDCWLDEFLCGLLGMGL